MRRGRHANPATEAFGGAPYGATKRVRGVPDDDDDDDDDDDVDADLLGRSWALFGSSREPFPGLFWAVLGPPRLRQDDVGYHFFRHPHFDEDVSSESLIFEGTANSQVHSTPPF